MKKAKIVLNLRRLSDSEIETQSVAIATALTNNPNFPEPLPNLAVLNNSLKLYTDSLALAKNGGRVQVALKKEAREKLELSLTNLAADCSYIARSNRGILASAGFNLNTETSTPRTLSYPENFTVEVGNNPGEALVYLNRVKHAKSYVFLWGATPVINETWLHSIESKPMCIITGLTPGTTYSFKIGIGGSKGQTVYTKVISQMVV